MGKALSRKLSIWSSEMQFALDYFLY